MQEATPRRRQSSSRTVVKIDNVSKIRLTAMQRHESESCILQGNFLMFCSMRNWSLCNNSWKIFQNNTDTMLILWLILKVVVFLSKTETIQEIPLLLLWLLFNIALEKLSKVTRQKNLNITYIGICRYKCHIYMCHVFYTNNIYVRRENKF